MAGLGVIPHGPGGQQRVIAPHAQHPFEVLPIFVPVGIFGKIIAHAVGADAGFFKYVLGIFLRGLRRFAALVGGQMHLVLGGIVGQGHGRLRQNGHINSLVLFVGQSAQGRALQLGKRRPPGQGQQPQQEQLFYQAAHLTR